MLSAATYSQRRLVTAVPYRETVGSKPHTVYSGTFDILYYST